MAQNTVFISYSHKDEPWKDRLVARLEANGLRDLRIWHDRLIGGGEEWYDRICHAIEQAMSAICLVSPSFLSSKFIRRHEVPALLERRERAAMLLIPVLVEPCPWQQTGWLLPIQMVPRDGKTLMQDFQGREDSVFDEIGGLLRRRLDDPDYMPAPGIPAPEVPARVDLDHLAVTEYDVVGRDHELHALDQAWRFGGTHVVALVGWGGVGKSTLVQKWIERMAREYYRGARNVFGWTFYDEGARERTASADTFIEQALRWFGDEDPARGSPWEKGERLARLVGQERNLLILDGIELFQSSVTGEQGAITDPALGMLLRNLARQNRGLCLVTTRSPIRDLDAFPQTARQIDLEELTADSGAALLRIRGLRGSDEALRRVALAFGGHALALNLLAAYLVNWPRDSTLEQALELSGSEPRDGTAQDAGHHAGRVLSAMATRLGEGPELQLLRLLSLFDRPARPEAVSALREGPLIPFLTDRLHARSEGEWALLLSNLRRCSLLSPKHTGQEEILDAHPIVRQHFAELLKSDHPESWRAGHAVLFEHLCATSPRQPETLEAMIPLVHAVAHGCKAQRYPEAFSVFEDRIKRNRKNFLFHELGAVSTELALLSNFFEHPWDRVVPALRDSWDWILSDAGFYLRALGRLEEAIGPSEQALGGAIGRRDMLNAAIRNGNLAELLLLAGRLGQGLQRAAQAVAFADEAAQGVDERVDGRWKKVSFQRWVSRSQVAAVLHYMGRLQEARAYFEAAEDTKQRLEGDPGLDLVPGYRYCELLLDLGETSVALERGLRLLRERGEDYPRRVGLYHLAVARAQRELGDRKGAWHHLNQASSLLRHAGVLEFIVALLLERALQHGEGDADHAEAALEEAAELSERTGGALHKVDCEIGHARLGLQRGDAAGARVHLSRAADVILATGYGRMATQALELARQLGLDASDLEAVVQTVTASPSGVEDAIREARRMASQVGSQDGRWNQPREGSEEFSNENRRKEEMGILDGIKLGRPSAPLPEAPAQGFSEGIKQLCDRAGLKIQSVDERVMRALFSVKGGRKQQLILQHAGDLAGKPIVKITSPVADLRSTPIDGDAALKLLKASGSLKIAAFAIDGDHLVVQQGMILPELTAEELRDIAITLALFADEAEKELTGSDHF